MVLEYTKILGRNTRSCVYGWLLCRMFEDLVMQSARYKNLVPVALLLGFYVSLVVARWWASGLAMPDNTHTAILLATHIPGNDSRAFEIRSRVIRYINLTCTMVFAHVSAAVHKKYPHPESLVTEHLATELEGRVLAEAEDHGCRDSKWLPLAWSCQLVHGARDEGFLQAGPGMEALVAEILNLQSQCRHLVEWHEFNVPLIYTQVVTIAVYTYFLFSLVSEQYLDESRHYPNYEVDLVVPVFALLELVCCLGWLKVAQALLNPFGFDDQSFDLLRILEDTRHSGFVICHTRYGQYSAEAQWRPTDNSRMHIVDLGVLPGALGEILTPDTVLGCSM
ncbi:bestrophin-2 isoform X2 [Procambarus clarkii]|uniref:bestrophin-2 isoform X2 n=1 Tax=Procambarus clarkii TaxID=6728 RepID=UPI001E6714F5|nr:bestrophin-2-like isoform X2 [Procambarus clarkii]